jgi:hypothetical protein
LLEAAVRQKGMLESRGEVISRLIAVYLAEYQHAVLRALSCQGSADRAPLSVGGYRESLIDAMQLDAYGWLVYAREYRGGIPGEEASEADPPFLGRLFWAPYVRLGFASTSGHLRRARALALARDPCDPDIAAFDREVTSAIALEDVIARAAVPSLARAWVAGLRADLDAERTRLILEARERMRRTGDWGAWEPVPSEICGGYSWLRERTSDGRLTIHPEPPLDLPDLDPKIPREWSFTLSSARCR